MAHSWRRGIRLFSSAGDAPRSRRPTDVVLLALAVVSILVLAFPAPGPTSIDSLVTGLVRSLPGLFGWFWEIANDLLIVWTLVLVALALLGRGRRRLLFEEVLAGALAVGIALETTLPIGMVAAFAVGSGSAAIVHLLFGSPAGRLTLDQVADAWPSWASKRPGSGRRRWSPAGWPSPPPRTHRGARSR
ncbi:MAG TPA: hypothetical protein VL330_26235 [Actinomycetes bacterium]|nr:hypothetical protein [Actinomycetes bacterium]